MTEKQKRFCEEYLIDQNATQAAIRAGYSKRTATAAASRLLTNVNVRAYIDKQLQQIHSQKVATAAEVMEYLTSVQRGESQSAYITVEGVGEGCSQTVITMKTPDEKDRLKAAELLGKCYGIFTDRVQASVELPTFMGEGDLE